MPGSDAGEVITLDSSSEDEEGDVGEELFEETLGKKQKKKSEHKRFVSDSSNDKDGRKSRSSGEYDCEVEGDSDADFVIDTDTTVSKFDDDMMLDTHRNADEWPESSDGDRISLDCVLTTDSSISPRKDDRPKRRAIECFNCGGPHIIGKCQEPRDQARIARAMRQQRMNRTPDVGRYHDAGDADLAARFRAGIVSPELADALSMRRNELPEWIYRMRKLGFVRGYPPGYLKQALVSGSAANDVLQFHTDQPETESGRADELSQGPSQIDPKKVIYYFGFNKPARDGTRDREGSWYTAPSFESFVSYHQEELNRRHKAAEQAHRQKRRHGSDDRTECSPSKKAKHGPVVVDMDVSSDDEPTPSGLLPPPPPPPIDVADYEALTEEELEQLLAKKQREIADMDEIGSPEPENDDVADAPVLIPTGDNTRVTTPPSVERRLIRHTSSRSLDVMIGTPLGAGSSAQSKPSLDEFSKGIVPFSAKEEATDEHKGFFKRMMTKLKEKTFKRGRQPKTRVQADPADVPRLEKRKGGRLRKQKN